ncbi:outer membrane protein [Rhodoplanes sp. SY1]|uniref:outer membrane protein n=1 Tax=Rhodoplanes sp. SY1 TaxID=3166646 RepID=UPI0038B4ADBD
MKKLLLATAAILATGAMAQAADLPARMPVKAPPVVAPVFSWTGCYIGGFAGGAWSADDNVNTTYSTVVGFPTRAYGYSSDSSFIGGGTLGCNWQPAGSPFVLGLEGEVGYISLESSAFDPTIPPALGSIVSSTKVGDWYSMVTGRLGYSWDRAMIYVKGGVAFVDVETAIGATFPATVPGGPAAAFAGAVSDTIATWTVGGGIEWAFDMNWSIKAEYMYIGLDETQTLCGGGVVVPTTTCFSNDIGGIHTAKVGLNYRFGGGAPLVARY